MNKKTYEVIVPATSANIGAGIDTIGIAFNLYNKFYFKEIDSKKVVIEGVPETYQNNNNLVYQSCLNLFKQVNYQPKGIWIKEECQIPFGRGLGSSASCIIGGLLGANAISSNQLSQEEILTMASQMEGHPDNVTPALYGNLTASMMTDKKTFSVVRKVNPKFRFFVCIPDFPLLTKQSRAILKKEYPISEITFNISHSIMTFEALQDGNEEILKYSLEDKIHQPFRFELIKDSEKIVDFVRFNNYIGCFLSGAGPSIIIISIDKSNNELDQLKQFLKTQCKNWQVKELFPDRNGTQVIEI